MLSYHDVRTLHYLSQGMEPLDSVPQLQSHFEAWKVREGGRGVGKVREGGRGVGMEGGW